MTEQADDDRGRERGPRELIDRRAQPVRAGVIVPDVRGHASAHGIESRKAEFEGLSAAIGLEIVFSEIVKVREIRPSTYIGGGHVKAIADRVKEG